MIPAEARGKLRVLKRDLLPQAQRIERSFVKSVVRQQVEAMLFKGSAKGRSRAHAKVMQALGPGARLWDCDLHGEQPSVSWGYLKPTKARTRAGSTPEDPGLDQDCVMVKVVTAGVKGKQVGVGAAPWTITFSDHALHRLFERSHWLDPVETMWQAHDNVLRVRESDAMAQAKDAHFLLPAGDGAFVVMLALIGPDETSLSTMVHARTWLSHDMLWQDQRLALVAASDDDDEPVLGQSFLTPFGRVNLTDCTITTPWTEAA